MQWKERDVKKKPLIRSRGRRENGGKNPAVPHRRGGGLRNGGDILGSHGGSQKAIG